MIALTRSHQLILLSVFSVPVMVAVGAVGHLVSLDASVPQPLVVPSLEDGRTEMQTSIVPDLPDQDPASQTDRERKNAAQAQLQDADWLMKRGQFKEAKTIYQALLDRSDLGQNSDLKDKATQRLEKLEKAIVAANQRDKRTQEKLKAEAKKKSLLKPEVKSALKKPADPMVTPVTMLVTPVSISAPERLESSPEDFPPINVSQPPAVRDLTTELGEPLFEPEAVPVTPRLVPNSGNE